MSYTLVAVWGTCQYLERLLCPLGKNAFDIPDQRERKSRRSGGGGLAGMSSVTMRSLGIFRRAGRPRGRIRTCKCMYPCAFVWGFCVLGQVCDVCTPARCARHSTIGLKVKKQLHQLNAAADAGSSSSGGGSVWYTVAPAVQSQPFFPHSVSSPVSMPLILTLALALTVSHSPSSRSAFWPASAPSPISALPLDLS